MTSLTAYFGNVVKMKTAATDVQIIVAMKRRRPRRRALGEQENHREKVVIMDDFVAGGSLKVEEVRLEASGSRGTVESCEYEA